MEDIQKILFDEVSKISEPLGTAVVECSVKRGKNGFSIIVVIDKQGGVTVDDCERVSRLLGSRIDVLELGGLENYSLQISSPGIDREFRDRREYNLFKSRNIKVTLLHASAEEMGVSGTLLKGKLLGMENDIIRIENEEGVVSVPLSSIKRTKLDG
jgi:ribosome maturation factor RimP